MNFHDLFLLFLLRFYLSFFFQCTVRNPLNWSFKYPTQLLTANFNHTYYTYPNHQPRENEFRILRFTFRFWSDVFDSFWFWFWFSFWFPLTTFLRIKTTQKKDLKNPYSWSFPLEDFELGIDHEYGTNAWVSRGREVHHRKDIWQVRR